MLADLEKYDSLGTKKELLFLLFDVLSVSEPKLIEDVKTLCIHQSYSFGNSFSGAIHLMELLGFIQINDYQIKTDKSILNYNRESFFDNNLIFQKIFGLLEKDGKLDFFFNLKTTKQNYKTHQYYIKGNKIPFSLNYIKKLLLNVGFLELIENSHNDFSINETFKDFFNSHIISRFNKKSNKRRLSLIKLKEIQEIQSKQGFEAECYVLNFELSRLTNHLAKSNIRIISEEYSNAGYDIESFDAENSIVIDKFIEVKSYSGNLSFYWSKNEIETAKELGESYWIYLVDINKIDVKDYEPIMKQNPYESILKNDIWEKQVDKYKIELLNANA